MTRSYRLLAERGQLPQGIVSLGVYEEDPSAAEVFGLYVVPDARGTGVSWRLVEAAAAWQRRTAMAALLLGGNRQRSRDRFRQELRVPFKRLPRPSRASDLELGEQEVALVLSLELDTTSVPNPTSGKATTREGPVS
jgi:GNAT superfamily N-acetyltransferase